MAGRIRLRFVGTLMSMAIAASAGVATAQKRSVQNHNLDGVWDPITMTPLQRPPEFGDEVNFTPEQAAEYERAVFERGSQNLTRLGFDADAQIDLSDVWTERPKLDDLRTSLIVDPPNGRLPSTVPAAASRARFKASYDDPESSSLSERCIVVAGLAGMNGNVSLASPPLVPAVVYENVLQIVETANTVVIASEWIPDARVVRIG